MVKGFTYRRRLPGQGGHGNDVHQRSGGGAAGQGIDRYPELAAIFKLPSPSFHPHVACRTRNCCGGSPSGAKFEQLSRDTSIDEVAQDIQRSLSEDL